MPKSLINSCVKNVYYMFNKTSISSVNTSTKKLLNKYLPTNWVQKLTTKQLYQLFTATISTYKNTKFNLLNNSFTHYPHSLLLRLKKEI